MPTTPAKARAANVTVITRWSQVYNQTASWSDKIAMKEASKSHSNLYAFQNAVGKMKRKGRGIVFRDIGSQAIEVVNDRWDDGIRVSADEVDDDQLGIYLPTVGLLGNRAKKWPDQQISLLMKNGDAATSLCHDGLPYFSAAHVTDTSGMVAGTWSNFDTGAGFALSETTYNDAVVKMMTYPDQAGEPIGIMPRYLVVPPALRLTAKKIINATINATGATNTLQDEVEVVVIPELAGTGFNADWYLLADLAGLRAFGWQDRMAPQLIAKTSPTDDNMYFDDDLLFAIKARGEFYYGPAYLAYKAHGA